MHQYNKFTIASFGPYYLFYCMTINDIILFYRGSGGRKWSLCLKYTRYATDHSIIDNDKYLPSSYYVPDTVLMLWI